MIILLLIIYLCVAFTYRSKIPCPNKLKIILHSSKDNNYNSRNSISKLLFIATENFGKLTSNFSPVNDEKFNILEKSDNNKKLSLDEISKKIKKEYEVLFWVTGNMDMSLWESNCTFTDPFNSFGGNESTKRFKSNADNLGKFVLNPKSKITTFNVTNGNEYDIVSIGWTFSSQLKLPWKPILAASGITNHYISKSTRKIYLYEETWKSKPFDVVKRLFIPGPSIK